MKKSILFITLILQSFLLLAQTSFTASVNKNKVGVNEQFSLTFTVNGNGDRFAAPNLSNFSILAGPSTSSSTTIINGKMSQENSYTYYLRAKKVGIFTIGPAYITVDGKEYRTKNLSIQVLKSSPKSTSNHTPEAKAKENVFLELDLTNPNPYVGEQIVATYKLYFSQEIRSPELLEQPSYTGFWHEDYDLGDNYPVKEEIRNGKKFQVAILKKLVLIPQRSGKLPIAGMDLDVPVAIPTNQRDFFGRRRSRMINIICSTGDKVINVKNLPSEGKPSNFSGAVGAFEFTTKLDRDSIQTNESASLSMRISGTGNLRMIELPEFDIPNDIEAYEPKYKESLKLKSQGLNGYKRVEYLLIPRNKGAYKINSASFSYFNPKKKKYITIESPSYTLNVNGDSNGNSNAVVVNNITKEDVSFIGKDILYIKTSIKNIKNTKELFFGSTSFLILLGLPILLALISLLIVVLVRKSIIDIKSWKKGSASQQVSKQLLKLQNEKYAGIESSLQLFFFEKWQLDRAHFNKESIREILLKNGVNETLILELDEIIKTCEMTRFTSQQNNQNADDLIKRVIRLIEKLDNY
jgi:hypothetical protein